MLARRTTGRPRASLVAALLVGISAPMFVYATQVYPEIPAALCVVILVLISLPSTGGVGRGLATALLLAGLMWLGVKYAPLAACLGLAAFARLSTAGRIALVATAVPIGVHYLAFHWLTYGDFTPYAVNLAYAGQRHTRAAGASRGAVRASVPTARLVGRPRVRARALGAHSRARAARRVAGKPTPQRRSVALLLAPVAVQLLVATFLSITMRGWWFPGRMLVVVLPLLVPMVATALVALAHQRWSAALLVALAFGTLSATAGLWLFASRGDVTVAVNPFDAGGLWLDGTRPVFPLYTAYTAETLALSALWTALGSRPRLGHPPLAPRLT